MAKNLKNTVLIENEEYNINAIHSEIAEQIKNPLTVKESGKKVFDFNGHFDDGVTEQVIDYVPTSGGKFTGLIYVEGSGDEKNLSADSVITSGQVNDRITDLTGIPVCSFNADSYKVTPLIGDDNQIYNLKTVVGTAENFEKFKKLLVTRNGNQSRGLRFSYVESQSSTCNVHGIENDATYTEFDVIIPYKAILINPLDGIMRNRSVTGMTESAFKGTSIKSVVIPDCIKIVSKQAFMSCTSLTNVTILPGVLELGESSFSGCTALTSITLPSTITKINKNAFASCTSLKTVYYGGTAEEWAALKTTATTGNAALTAITPTYINQGPISDILKSPFLYICKDVEDVEGKTASTLETLSQRMFLKLSATDDIIEISKGATRLNSTNTAYDSTEYYTYEGLAEILARINKRLEAIGGEELKVTTTDLTKMPALDLNTGTLKVGETVIANVTTELSPTDIPTIQTIKKIVTELANETGVLKRELEELDWSSPENDLFAVSSRIDRIEDWQQNFKANDIEYYDTIEWTY